MSVEDAIAPALQAAGLSVSTARFDAGAMGLFRYGEFTTPLYTAASLNPWQAPFLFNVFTNDLSTQAGKPNEILNVGTRYVGTGSRRTLIGDPLAKLRENLDVDPETIAPPKQGQSPPFAAPRAPKPISATGRTLAPRVGTVPKPVVQAAVLLIRAAKQAKEHHNLFKQSIHGTEALLRISMGDPAVSFAIRSGLQDDASSTDFAPALAIFRKADIRYLMAGANDLLLAVQDACKLVASVSPDEKYAFEFETEFGVVALSGGTKSVWATGRYSPPWLIIDTGGDDTYADYPNANIFRWASIVIDTNGNDRYIGRQGLPANVSTDNLGNVPVSEYPKRKDAIWNMGPGCAYEGYCLLFDLQGDDIYRSASCGIASGRLGVAVVHDGAGNDVYDGYADSLGFGMFGAGILEDISGNDTYSGFTQVQGVGQTAGFGALIDRAGNDTYIANDAVIDFPSAQSAEHNNSMSQGAGNGTRRDYLDAHQLAGGIGVLLDESGDDKYYGAVFAQGVGYLQGIGLLRDKSGMDSYNGMWYVQGASAHFAVGWLQDDQGHDKYTATMNMAQGAGHDLGAGYLIELGGNDVYVAPNLSLGAGNANGIGLLLEISGNDSYTSSGLTLGQSGESTKGSLRERLLCFGVFADLGGTDAFPNSLTWAKNGATQVNWTGKQRMPEESQLGVFYDR